MGLSVVPAEHIRQLMHFHRWRQDKIDALLRKQDTGLFEKSLSGSFGSLFIVLKHLVWAEKVWFGRVNPDAVAAMGDTDVNGLLSEWAAVSRKWEAFVEGLTEDPNEFRVDYFNTRGEKFSNTLAEIVVHLVDHASYHIGQMMNALRGFGVEPVSTNYIHFLREN